MNDAYPLDLSAMTSSARRAVGGGESALDMNVLIRIVRRRMGVIIATVLTVFMLTAVVTFQIRPVYSAAAQLIIEPKRNTTIDLAAAVAGTPPDSAMIATEVKVMQSSKLIEKVVKKLDLVNDPEFNWRLAPPSGRDKFMAQVKGLLKGLSPSSPEEVPVAKPPEDPAKVMEDVVQAVQGHISIGRVDSTYIIAISASSHNPETAAKLANTLADLYLVENLEAKFENTRRQNEWLDERLGDLRLEVNKAESEVEAYRAQTGLLTAQGSTLTEQQISDLQAQLIIQQAQLDERNARLQNVRRQIASGSGADSIAEALSSPVIGSLRAQQAEVIRRRGDLMAKYGERHPDVVRVLAEESDLQRQIEVEVRRIVANLENEVVIARQRVSSLNASIGGARSRLAGNNKAQVALREYERNADASRTLYEAFLQKFKQNTESEGIEEADARVISDAVVPGRPTSPKTSVNLAIGLILGLALAGVLTVISEVLNNHISSGSEIERLYGVTYIGNTPLLPPRKNLPPPGDYLIEKPHSAFAESIRNIRASIIFASLDRAARTVAVISSLPDEGKTTITYCLGRMSAISGTKTIIIDGDFRRRQLTEIAGLKPERGLLEYLFGETSLADAVMIDEKSGLHILPLTDRKHTPRDVFGSRAFDALLSTLKQSYDLIVIDTGPILLMAETRVVTGKVDQVLLAARWHKTQRASIAESLQILKDFKANLTGVVLTMVDLRKRRQHAYTSANYKAYSKYYMND